MIKKDFREQDIKIGIKWILQQKQFERLEKVTGCMHYEKRFYMVLIMMMMTMMMMMIMMNCFFTMVDSQRAFSFISALGFIAVSIVRDPNYRESPTRRGQDDRGGCECNTDDATIKIASLPRKHSPPNCGENHKGVFLFLPQRSLHNLNHIRNTSIKHFIRFSLSDIKISYLNNNCKYFSTKSFNSLLDFLFSIYYHRTIDLIESKIYKPFSAKPKKKAPENVYIVFFENKGVQFISISCM